MPYNWQTIHLPLVGGLDTSTDPRVLAPPSLAVAQNAEFEEVGGIQLRKPYASIGTSILGGGTISNCRRIVPYGDELLLFTKDTIYTWSVRDSKWISKATYLAPKLEEQSVFVRTTKQTLCDRAELSNVVFYTWFDEGATDAVYVAAADKTTGAVILAPYSLGASSTRPRLTALTNKVILTFVYGAATLKAVALDPSDVATSAAVSPTHITNCANNYDVCAMGSSLAYVCAQSPAATYHVGAVTEALAVSNSVKARTADGPVAIAYSSSAGRLQIARGNGVNVQGDLLNSSTRADVYTGQAIGAIGGGTIYQIVAAYRSVADSGAYRAYVYWSDSETAIDGGGVHYNYVKTNNTLGTTAAYGTAGLASHPFDHDGSVYVWLAYGKQAVAGSTGFVGQVENSYFLVRDDELLIAKAANRRGGGFSAAIGHLPSVQSLGSGAYAWCGVERRIITVGTSQSGYDAEVPHEIKVTFDSDEARRCVKLSKTLYISGGQICQFDGTNLAEVGFHTFPASFSVADTGVAGDADRGIGVFTYKATYRWENAKGELERSSTVQTWDYTATTTNKAEIQGSTDPLSLKAASVDPTLEIWRTLINPTFESPFYLVTSKDPSATSGDNAHVSSGNIFLIYDNFDDETLDDKENNPENAGVLVNLAPPAATIVTANHERLFLAGVSGDPNRIWYSKTRGDAEIASFNDVLTIDVPEQGGDITALAFLDETLICFRESAIYAITGEGLDNTGNGFNYGPARRLSADVGAVNAESVAVTPAGLLFKSRKGWHILERGGSVRYIGAPVSSFDSDTVVAVHVLESKHQVRCLSSSARLLCFDYSTDQWSEWTITDGVHAALWSNTYYYLSSSAVKAEQSTYSSVDYALDIEFPWIKVADLQGAGAVRRIGVLGEYRSAHDLRIRVAYNYAESDASGVTWTDDKYWSPSPTTVGGPLQVIMGPKYPRCQSFKVRLTTYTDGSTSVPPPGEALKLTGLSFEIGQDRGLYRRNPAAQKY